MKDAREVILFIDEPKEYASITIANDLYSRWNELGNPIVLPDSNKKNAPYYVFSKNEDFQLQGGKDTVSFIVGEDYFDKLASIVFDIVDAYEEVDVHFKRMGYVVSNYFNKKCVDKVLDIYLNKDNIPENIGEYNISFYNKLSVKGNDINVWERFITDSQAFKELLVQYDFNTPNKEVIKFDMKYIKEFFKVSEEYMEQRNLLDD